jgi:murein DD-endopeptidase MepM/ murein hydrolase activator NlpD
LAENNEVPDPEATPKTSKIARLRGDLRRAAAAGSATRRSAIVRPRAAASSPRRATAGPLRSFATVVIVGGLVATVAIPAYGALRPTEDAVTLQQVAEGDAQSLVVASDTETSALTRDSYSATTPEEIAKKKAEEAAAAAARAAASVASSGGGASAIDISMVSPGSGAVRWPVTTFHIGDWGLNGYRTAARPTHNGVDMLNGAGTPIFAAADGVVRIAQDGYYTFGNAVVIDSVINGQVVTTLYAHMIWGSRLVEVGQTVSAGQMIGQMGMTGYATTPHLHFEVKINGGYVDPWAWLNANAG